MEHEIYKFYESKSKIFSRILGGIFMILVSYLMSQRAIVPEKKFIGYVGMICFGLASIVWIYKIISNPLAIEVTSTYIKILNFEKLLWSDITNIREFQIYSVKFLYFYVEDISKYKLTFGQKINKTFKHPPFYIALDVLSKEDLEKLQQLIRLYADHQ